MAQKVSGKASGDERGAVLEAAERLGYEVGLRGHIDNVGEVGARKRELLRRARDLGILEKMMFKYAAAKEEGTKERRMSIYATGPEPSKGVARQRAPVERRPKAADLPSVEPGPRGLHFEDQERLESAAPAEKVMISHRALMSLVEAAELESSSKYRRFYDVLMNIADVSDEVRYVRGRETLERVLSVLQRNGWIESYSLEAYGEAANEVIVSVVSTYARLHDRSRKPVCRLLARTLERATSAALGAEVRMVEVKCMAQGHRRCVFSSY